MTLLASSPTTGGGTRSQRLDAALRELLIQAIEVEAAAVVSFDGLPMASALPSSMDEDRVAAMSAALLSLGERAAAGLGRGELSQVYIEGDAGTVFLVSADDEAVLVAVAAKGAKVGMMLYEVRRAAGKVAEALRTEDVPDLAAPAEVTAPDEPTPSTQPALRREPVTPPQPAPPAGPDASIDQSPYLSYAGSAPQQRSPLIPDPLGPPTAAPAATWS